MPKRATDTLTLLSAVACVGSLMWVGRSWFRLDAVIIPMDRFAAVGAYTIDGRLLVWHQRLRQEAYFRTTYQSHPAAEYRHGLGQSWREIARVRWLSIGWYFTSRHGTVILPLWLLPLLAAILPVRWLLRLSRSRTRGFPVVEAIAEQT